MVSSRGPFAQCRRYSKSSSMFSSSVLTLRKKKENKTLSNLREFVDTTANRRNHEKALLRILTGMGMWCSGEHFGTKDPVFFSIRIIEAFIQILLQLLQLFQQLILGKTERERQQQAHSSSASVKKSQKRKTWLKNNNDLANHTEPHHTNANNVSRL